MTHTEKSTNKDCEGCKQKRGELLTHDKVKQFLEELSGWQVDISGKEIWKDYVLRDFIQSVDFVNAIADVAEAANHHPDIKIAYNKVTLTLSTHSVGGLTKMDFIVASQIDALPFF